MDMQGKKLSCEDISQVSYKWERVQTGCCMGVVGCHGSFTSSVGEGELVTIGEIPAGKKDLDVQLTAASDVHACVELYAPGAVIQGWAPLAVCPCMPKDLPKVKGLVRVCLKTR